MKKEVWHICEICGYKSKDASAVEECEKCGIPDKNEFPVGLIFNNPDKGFYKGMTFAIAQTGTDGHSFWASLWACRDTGVGDTLGKEYCGSGGTFPLGKKDVPDHNHPTFKRMVRALEEKGIPITVWDGKKVVEF